MGLHQRPHFAVKRGCDPFLLQRLVFKVNAQDGIAAALRPQQRYTSLAPGCLEIAARNGPAYTLSGAS